MTQKTIRIATRKSPLALWQARHVATRLECIFPNVKTELVAMATEGDKFMNTPLVGGKGLFIKELEYAVLEHKADIAVHSMKDVPIMLHEDLHLAAILPGSDPTDAFVSNNFYHLKDLPEKFKIGTSSLRRQCQLKEKFPHVDIALLRGNINTRLNKLKAGMYDAIILASAGLKRLGLAKNITQQIKPEIILPAVGQGIICIESRRDDTKTLAFLQALHDAKTAIRITAERTMNASLNGNCQVPIAGFAEIQDTQLTMRGLVGSPNGSIIYRATKQGHCSQAEKIGLAVADDLLAQGANKILQALL